MIIGQGLKAIESAVAVQLGVCPYVLRAKHLESRFTDPQQASLQLLQKQGTEVSYKQYH